MRYSIWMKRINNESNTGLNMLLIRCVQQQLEVVERELALLDPQQNKVLSQIVITKYL